MTLREYLESYDKEVLKEGAFDKTDDMPKIPHIKATVSPEEKIKKELEKYGEFNEEGNFFIRVANFSNPEKMKKIKTLFEKLFKIKKQS